jgi:hypothetical protein
VKNYPEGKWPCPNVAEIHNAKNAASYRITDIIKELSDELGIYPDKFKLNMNHQGTVWVEVIL